MRPSRSRRVQAQRKFAQGAYVPPNVAPAAVATADRRDVNQDARNVFINRTSAEGLLDLISFQGIHKHLEPVVIIERLGDRNLSPNNNTNKERDDRQRKNNNSPNKMLPPKQPIVKTRKEYKRVHAMSLRSRRASKLALKRKQEEEVVTQTKLATRRKTLPAAEKSQKPKKKCPNPKVCLESSEFSLDDNRPLTYFAKCSTPKRRAAAISHPHTDPEPLAGPSGLCKNVVHDSNPKPDSRVRSYRQGPTRPVSVSSTSTAVFVPVGGSYYNSEHNIHRWMNDSLTPESRRTDEPALEEGVMVKLDNGLPVSCPAEKWASVNDIVALPTEEIDLRCTVCRPCERINKLYKLSGLLKGHVKIDITGDDKSITTLDQRSASGTENNEQSEVDDGFIYLELLPKQNYLIKLKNHEAHGKGLMSMSLVPRCDAKKNRRDFLLSEHEYFLDQLTETLMLSQNVPQGQRRVTVDSYRSDDSDILASDPEGAEELQRLVIKENRKKLLEAEELNQIKPEDDKQTVIIILGESEDATPSQLVPIEDAAPSQLVPIEDEPPSQLIPIEDAAPSQLVPIEDAAPPQLVPIDEEQASLRWSEEDDHLMAEVDELAKALENEKDAKGDNAADMGESAGVDSGATGKKGFSDGGGGQMVEAPLFRPTEEEFNDPIAYFEKIWPDAYKYGICKVVPPAGWEPKCKIDDDMRFDVTNQYISRLYSRWGPAARELCAIKLCLQQQSVNFTRPPLLDGVEVNLPKLYHFVQRLGGLESVINRKKWGKVAEEMKFNKSPCTERKLDQIYVKFLLPYDTLAHQERQEIMRKVEKAWNRKNQKLLDRALNPFHRQKYMLGESDSSDDETEDEETGKALAEAEDCIVSGAYMNLHKFKKVAANAYDNHYGVRTNALFNSSGPSTAADGEHSIQAIEQRYWQVVLMGTEHMCVNTAAIDTGVEGYGFTKNKNEPYGRHPWNLKMFIHNNRNMLRYLGPVLGVTVPTLHLSMLYSTSCWHKDPQMLPWLEYEHLGADKIWYAIPHDQADNFRKAVETLIPTSCQNKGIWLPSEIAMIPPHILCQHNVSLSRVVQYPNEFVLVFPNTYSCSISTGYTESESVYFAPKSWLNNLSQVFQEARESCEPTMFSLEKLLLAIAQDQRVETCTLKVIQPLLDNIITAETNNRKILVDSGIKVVTEATKPNNRRKRNTAWDARDQDECDYCRCTLYLSKVRGLTSKKSTLCLEHAIKLQNCPKYKYKNMTQIELHVYVTVRELNTISENIKHRLEIPLSP